jgi:hypothetical protein
MTFGRPDVTTRRDRQQPTRAPKLPATRTAARADVSRRNLAGMAPRTLARPQRTRCHACPVDPRRCRIWRVSLYSQNLREDTRAVCEKPFPAANLRAARCVSEYVPVADLLTTEGKGVPGSQRSFARQSSCPPAGLRHSPRCESQAQRVHPPEAQETGTGGCRTEWVQVGFRSADSLGAAKC